MINYNIIILLTFLNVDINSDVNINNRKNLLNEKTKANLQRTAVRIEAHVHCPPPTPFLF